MPPSIPATHSLDVSDFNPSEMYFLLRDSIVPRPIAWVSTISRTGATNIAPFSFFTIICEAPPTICFAPVRKADGTKKDTLRNIEAPGEFVVNVVGEEHVPAMSHSAATVAPEVDEFERI